MEQTQEACDRVKLHQLRPHRFPQPAKDRTMPEPTTAYRFRSGPVTRAKAPTLSVPAPRKPEAATANEEHQFLSPG